MGWQRRESDFRGVDTLKSVVSEGAWQGNHWEVAGKGVRGLAAGKGASPYLTCTGLWGFWSIAASIYSGPWARPESGILGRGPWVRGYQFGPGGPGYWAVQVSHVCAPCLQDRPPG